MVMTDNPMKDETPTGGLRCAWCAKVLREPVGFTNPADHLSWTHGMCWDCQQRFEEDGAAQRARRSMFKRGCVSLRRRCPRCRSLSVFKEHRHHYVCDQCHHRFVGFRLGFIRVAV
jgi:phage FluMu protein Com